MVFSTANLGKPSNKKLKLIADILLYTLPLYMAAVMALQPVSPTFVMWANFALTLLAVTIKGISKFTSEEVPTVTV